MKSKRVSKGIFGVLLALLLLVSAILSGRVILPAFADTTQYTSPLEDLQKDESFNAADYPENADDHSISVITIAESTDKELFVYTYQPCQKSKYTVATDINMSLSDSPDGTKLYGLTLLKSSGVFCKYKVNGLTVSEDEARHYNIVSIYREYDRYFDASAEVDNVLNKVAFPVGKIFIARTIDGKPIYTEQLKEVITITDKYVGNILYEGEKDIGWGIRQTAVNAMYVAFDSDKDITRLYEADVSYSTQSLQYKVKTNALQFWNNAKLGEAYDVQKGEAVPHEPVTLNYTAKDTAGRYSWYQIQSIDEFKNNVSKNGMELTTDAKEGLNGKKWVLNFATVDVEAQGADGMWVGFVSPVAGMFVNDPTVRTTLVGDVSILRLKFEHEEQVYNLGAVDGMQTGSNKPSNRIDGYDENNENFSFWQWLKDKVSIPWWVWLIIGVVILAILLPVFGVLFPAFGRLLLAVLKGIGKALLWLLKGLWWLICLPFKGIAALVKKCKSGSKSTKRRRKKA